MTTKVKQLVLLWWKASLYTEEMPLYTVKQVVLFWQNGSDTLKQSITIPNTLISNRLNQIVILFSKIAFFFWRNHQHSFYDLICKVTFYEIIYQISLSHPNHYPRYQKTMRTNTAEEKRLKSQRPPLIHPHWSIQSAGKSTNKTRSVSQKCCIVSRFSFLFPIFVPK